MKAGDALVFLWWMAVGFLAWMMISVVLALLGHLQ